MPQPIEILDLRHYTARQMRPLLAEEAGAWARALRWDYRSSIELLLEYLDSRMLPGYVATARGRIIGYTFCVYEEAKAVIGDLFVAPGQPDERAVAHTLLRHLLETLDATPGVDRIEAQLLLFPAGVLTPVFNPAHVRAFPRLFLERESSRPLPVSAVAPPQELELVPWQPHFYQGAVELIHRAYGGHIDAEINDQYRTLHGSLRFLHNIIRFPGCGSFDAHASWIVRERTLGAPRDPLGVLLCSRISPEIGHITQLGVAPELRGRHLGRLLLDHCLARLPSLGLRALTLTVSEANEPALALYQSAGFTVRQRFDALVLERRAVVPTPPLPATAEAVPSRS